MGGGALDNRQGAPPDSLPNTRRIAHGEASAPCTAYPRPQKAGQGAQLASHPTSRLWRPMRGIGETSPSGCSQCIRIAVATAPPRRPLLRATPVGGSVSQFVILRHDCGSRGRRGVHCRETSSHMSTVNSPPRTIPSVDTRTRARIGTVRIFYHTPTPKSRAARPRANTPPQDSRGQLELGG